MDSTPQFDRILKLKLSGKFGHFRKFYTNASSLSYSIPPRTAICGLLGSVMKIQRDGYYDLFCSDRLGVAVSISPGNHHKKLLQTMNYAQDNKPKTPVNDLSSHKQCRLELLMPQGNGNLCFNVFLGYNSFDTDVADIEKKLEIRDFGYGLYLGQRQFLADLELINKYYSDDLSIIETSDYLDSAIKASQINTLNSDYCSVSMERMPLEQATIELKGKSIRQSIRFGDIVFEMNGKRIEGLFEHLVEVNNEAQERIAWL